MVEICKIAGSVHDTMTLMIDRESIHVASVDSELGSCEIDIEGRWKISEILENETLEKIYQAGPYGKYYSHYTVTEEVAQKLKDLKKIEKESNESIIEE